MQFTITPTQVRSVSIPLCIYALTRVLGAVFLAVGASRQPQLADTQVMHVMDPIPASPGYWGVLANWDGQWYKSIATNGYPEELPTAQGAVARNEWAFYPLYPMLVRLLMRAADAPFELAAGSLSLLCGALAVVLLYRLLLARLSPAAAGAAVTMLCAFPSAPVLQTAYTESLTLLLLVLAVAALQSRRYGAFLVTVGLLSLTRPVVLPLVVVAGVHLAWRLRTDRGSFTSTERIRLVAVLVAALATPALWPLIAAVATREPRAFFLTQSAWRYTGHDSFFAASYLGRAMALDLPILGFVAILGAVLVLVVLRRPSSLWGLEWRTWALVYPGYILASTQPTSSLLRYLLLAAIPFWPFAEAGASGETTVDRRMRWLFLVLLVAAGLIGQYLWVTRVFTVDVSPAAQPFP